MATQEQRIYPIRQGVIQMNGSFIEVSHIKFISRPSISRTLHDDKKCWVFYICLASGRMEEILTFDPLDTINLYEFAVLAWVGVKPSDGIDLNNLLGPNFFNNPV